MSRSSKVRKFSCRVLDFRYIFLIFISRQNKLVCAQSAPEKITRFVPLRVHLLEIRRLGSYNTLPRRRSGIFPPRRIFSTTNVYICGENAAHICGFYFMRLATSDGRVPDFIVLSMFTSVGECKVNEPTTVR